MAETNILVKYEDPQSNLMLDVIFDGETTWLTQNEMALLFHTSRSNIGLHIKTIYKDRELDISTTRKKYLQHVDNHRQSYVLRYNLDVVISVGYKVRSRVATRFRQWATNIIRERMTGDYSLLAQEEALRLLTRVQVDDSTDKLIGVATTEHKVRDRDQFLDAGDKGMYHRSKAEVEADRKIPDGKLYDYIGSAELGMHLYRLTQTAEALKVDARNGYVHEQDEAEEIHRDISERTRAMSHQIHQQFPEDMPKAINLEALKAKHRALLRERRQDKENPEQEKFPL